MCIAQQGVDCRDVVVARQILLRERVLKSRHRERMRGYGPACVATGAHFKDEQVMSWGSQIALGLAHLHDECKLVHQDLHNGNVMITGLSKDDAGGVLDVDNDALLVTTSVKILDLGLASFKSDHSRTTTERTMRMSTMRTMRTAATRRGSFVQISAEDVGGFKAIRAPEMHPTTISTGMVRFDAKVDVWALGILLTEAVLLSPIEE